MFPQFTPKKKARQELHESKSKLLKGGYVWDYIGTTIGVIKVDTRGLDYSSHGIASVLY